MSKKRKTSPLHKLFEEPNKAAMRAENHLSKFWALIAGTLGIKGPEWERMVTSWLKQTSQELGKGAIDKKNNLVKALAGPHMTWMVFLGGLSILSHKSNIHRIRMELHFYDAKGVGQVLGMDLVDRDAGNEVTAFAKQALALGVNLLQPGDIAQPEEAYVLEGFAQERFNGMVMKYRGDEPLTVSDTQFNGYSVADSMVMDEAFMPCLEWYRIVSPENYTSVREESQG